MSRRILLIEDSDVSRKAIRIGLEGFGYEVVEAADGAEGLEVATQTHFDAIVLDLLMPRMHGFEVIEHLRAHFTTRSTPIIVLTSKTFENDRAKAIEMGANAVLTKPCQPDEVDAALKKYWWKTRVSFWGVRGSIAAPGPETVRFGGNTPCVTVEHEGRMLILDAGTGLRRLGMHLMATAGGKPLSLDMLVTHTHWDHIQGFPFFVPAYVPGNRLSIYGPRSAGKPLERVIRGQQDPEYFPVALGEMAAKIEVTELRGEPLTIGPFHITYAYMNHPGVTLGYRIEVGGMVIVYATDTEPYRYLLDAARPEDGAGAAFGRIEDATLTELVRGADLYIADSQYTPAEYPKKMGWGHTCYLDALDVAIEANVRRVALFSHDPMHDDDMVDAKIAHCRELVASRELSLEVIGAAEGHDVILR
jgi:CheY-like chemotaxis protein